MAQAAQRAPRLLPDFFARAPLEISSLSNNAGDAPTARTASCAGNRAEAMRSDRAAFRPADPEARESPAAVPKSHAEDRRNVARVRANPPSHDREPSQTSPQSAARPASP